MTKRKTKNIPPAPRTEAIEMIRRINAVYDLILMGFNRVQIIEYGQKVDLKHGKTDWNVQDSTIDTYIAKAKERFEDESAIHRAEQLGLAISRLIYLWQKNVSIQDYKTALAVQKELNALVGLYPAKKDTLNININIQQIETLSTLAEQHGIALSDVFEEMINRFAQIENDTRKSNS